MRCGKRKEIYVEKYKVCPDFYATMIVHMCAALSYMIGYI
jgi:hypothetical protein